MSNDTWDELRRLNRELRQVRQELAKRPIMVRGGGSSPLRVLEILGGNTLSDGSTSGVKWMTPAPTTVPVIYNPAVDTSFIAGVGYANLYVDGSLIGKVLVANYTGNGSPIVKALVAGMVVIAGPTVSLPLVSDSTQSNTLYTPYSQ